VVKLISEKLSVLNTAQISREQQLERENEEFKAKLEAARREREDRNIQQQAF
jgi:hypothetical protein